MQKKTIFFVGALVCLFIAGWAYYQYQKPRQGVAGVREDHTLTAPNLYQAFITNEEAANRKYVDKVVKVSGVVQQVDSLQGGISIILAATMEGGVNCMLSEVGPLPRVGQQVTIKGRCTGFLMDVSLVDAVLEP